MLALDLFLKHATYITLHWVHAYNQYHPLVWGYIQLVHGHAIIIANTLTLETIYSSQLDWKLLESIGMGYTAFLVPPFLWAAHSSCHALFYNHVQHRLGYINTQQSLHFLSRLSYPPHPHFPPTPVRTIKLPCLVL